MADTAKNQTFYASVGGILAALVTFHTLFIAPVVEQVTKMELKHERDYDKLVDAQSMVAIDLKNIQINQAIMLDKLERRDQ